jgi:lactoylglutathione lyase
MDKAISFYENALDLEVEKKKEFDNFTLAFLTDKVTGFKLELTWLKEKGNAKYDLGDNEIHLAFVTDDFAGSYEKHKKMGCICYENKAMGLYFINDPDGYWIEILPKR